MEETFFEKTKFLKEEIGEIVFNCFEKAENNKIKDILMKRQQTSSYIKGITSYYLHKGLGGKLSHKKIIDLAAAVEMYSTSMVLLDNLVDKHNQRNGETTFLIEYGPEMTGLASIYSSNIGLIKLSPYLNSFVKKTNIEVIHAIGKAISSAISMDVEHPRGQPKILENIIKVNGITLGFPLGLVASTATSNKKIIFDIMKYGADTGTAFGLYEEIRDFIGEHGRGKASEFKNGRMPYFMAESNLSNNHLNLDFYIGRNFDDAEYAKILEYLKEKGSLKRTQKLIKNYLNYGKEVLQINLRNKEFKTLDLLRTTIESSLDKMI